MAHCFTRGFILNLFWLVNFVLSENFKSSKVSENLLKLIGEGEKSHINGAELLFDVVVTFNESTESILNDISTQSHLLKSRQERSFAVSNQLETHAHSNQKSVKQFLIHRNIDFHVLWISNQLHLPQVNSSVIIELASRFPEVSYISENLHLTLFKSAVVDSKANTLEAEWGIKEIKTHLALSLLNSSVSLPEIRVGIIDTGVLYSHEALRESYYGSYGWFDPYGSSNTLPNDLVGHGTHVTGTIVGKGGIGVFPHAKWMACRGCGESACTGAALISCGQFFLCPTLPDGSSKDCSKAPHVINNSWGGEGGQTFYDAVIRAWKAAGIVPVFAIGNSGPECRTAASPGDSKDVIGVGSVSQNSFISVFSSRGPSALSGTIKPDISAPGSSIRSSWITSDTAYSTLQGTSMASPHVTGVVAIMLAHNPNLTFDQIRLALLSGADRTSVKLNYSSSCGGIRETEFPNHVFGHGRVDAYQSLLIIVNQTDSSPSSSPPSPFYHSSALLSMQTVTSILLLLFSFHLINLCS